MKTVRIDDIDYQISWMDKGDIWLEPVGYTDWILLWMNADNQLFLKFLDEETPIDLSWNDYRLDTIESFVSENKDQFIKIQQS